MLRSVPRLAWIPLLIALALGLSSCREDAPSEPLEVLESSGPVEVFTEIESQVGLDVTHVNGMSGEYYFNEDMGGGGALFDYDRDGDLDLFLTQGHELAPGVASSHRDRLFRNDLEKGQLFFTEVTEESEIDSMGYGMGAAVGDFDKDGWPDLYVTTWDGPNQLFRNDGDGTFSDVTERAGVGETRWGSSASFIDIDGDDWIDLYVANYVDFSFGNHKECTSDLGLRDYCAAFAYEAVVDTLYRNRGDGTFEDISMKSGVREASGSGLGVVTADFDMDGRIDIYVTNDAKANLMWINQGDGTFKDEALLSGCALNADGQAEAGMGITAGDVDGDGDEDLFMTHLGLETNTLYLNDGTGNFYDRTVSSRLAAPSRSYTSFGTRFFDYDNDGWLDLFVANGAVHITPDLLLAGDPYPLHQPNQLFRNLGGVSFEEIPQMVLERSEVSRGVLFGDLDNDGDTDLVVINNAGALRVLRNDIGQDRPWIGFRLVGPEGSDIFGALAELERSDGTTQVARVRADGSYQVANDARLLFGLGEAGGASRLLVRWPGGLEEQWTDLEVGTYRTLVKGTGETP